MEYAILSASAVVNVIVADANFVAQYHPGAIRIDGLHPLPGIGWSWNGAAFLAPLTAVAPPILGTHGTEITTVMASARGGSGPGYSFADQGLPAGLSMSPDGLISGTPQRAGTSTYSVAVTDSDENSATASGVSLID